EDSGGGALRAGVDHRGGHGADEHHAFDADVDDAGPLGDELADGGDEEGSGEEDGGGEHGRMITRGNDQGPMSNDQGMTNDECPMTKEIRMTNGEGRISAQYRHYGLFLLNSVF